MPQESGPSALVRELRAAGFLTLAIELSAEQFRVAYVQYLDLRTHYADTSHPHVVKAKEVLEQARAFRHAVDPDWVEHQLIDERAA